MKMREKGKEIVTFDENPKLLFHKEEVSMHFNEQRIKTPLEVKKETTLRENFELGQDMSKKIDTQEKSGSSSSKIIPYIFYTSDDKARLRWSSDLHDCFVNAVEKLGGPQKATPKNVKDMMEVEGIALHHVKSHLQKFRLGKCNIREETELDNKRMFTFPQHMSNSYITTTNQQCLLNNDSYCNATFVPTAESPIIDSLHQGASSNTTLFSTTPSLVHTNIPHQTYISYPPYSTLEVAKTQLNALQHTSSTSQNRETTSRGTSNLSSSLTRDEEDLVDKYIDWSKVEERDIDQPDQF
ncbi:unnamed protein product [Cochlearia groenlandica]